MSRTAPVRRAQGGPAAVRRAGGIPARGRAAFTLTELAVVMGVILLLTSLLAVALVRSRQSAVRVQCINNLRVIGQAFSTYAMQHSGTFPDPLAAGKRWEDVLRGLVPSADVFRCGADEELFPAFGSSYDWRDTGDPASTLAGRRLPQVRRDEIVLAFESLPGWHAPRRINAVRLDGAVQSLDEQACLVNLLLPVHATAALESTGSDRDKRTLDQASGPRNSEPAGPP